MIFLASATRTVLYLLYKDCTISPVNVTSKLGFCRGLKTHQLNLLHSSAIITGHARINSHVHSVVIVVTYLDTELLHRGHTVTRSLGAC